MTTPEDSGRPRWSASEAAKRCGVGRATIQRRLEAGLIPGAERTAQGWSIPLDGLLAAGFTPDRPSPPAAAREHDRSNTERVRAADQLAQQVRVLEQQLATTKGELEHRLAAMQVEVERERARRDAAEQLAADRATHVEDLRRTLAMLTTGNATPPSAHATVPAPRQRGLLGRIVDNFGL